MDHERARQVANNEALFRDVNERIGEVSAHWAKAPEILCECGARECGATLAVARDAYEAVRANPIAFLVLPGHEQLDVERVVERRDDYLVVEKIGAGADVAKQLDPRSG